MSKHDRDIAEIALATRTDPMLSVLAGIAAGGGPTHSVGLLVNGMTIFGRTVDPIRMAEQMDAENRGIGERFKAHTNNEAWDDYIAKVGTMWVDRLKKTQEDERLLADNMAVELDQLPEEIARKVIRAREEDLTLADATVFMPGRAPHTVALLRIRLALVAGWWLVPTDAEGKASYTHPGPA